MAELKCPHCGQAFTVDDIELSSIVQQIRDKEFEKDLNSRISELEKHMQEKHELELEVQESEIKLQVKIKHETTNYENLESKVERCPHCGSVHFVKNGFNPHHRQKYRCKDCRRVFMATTGTMFSHSRTTFDIWSVFIAGELNSLTLEQQSVQTRLTKTTCFNMRHRLYKAASRIQKDIILSGNIELDPSYVKINLKGTKPDNMPRASKHRGKHKPIYSRHEHGLSGHKICLITAIDENDNMLFKIAGLGAESQEKPEPFRKHFKAGSMIICDDKACIKNFASNNDMIESPKVFIDGDSYK